MSQNHHVPLAHASQIASLFSLELTERGVPNPAFLVCGSIRRFRPECGDVDIAITSEAFTPELQLELSEILQDAVVTKKGIVKGGMYSDMKIEFYVAPAASFGALTLFATGSANFNIMCRRKANAKRWKLSQYGLYEREEDQLICGRYESEILQLLDLLQYEDPLSREVTL